MDFEPIPVFLHDLFYFCVEMVTKVGRHSLKNMSEETVLSVSCFIKGQNILNTGIPHYIVLISSIAFHRCYVFLQIEGRTLQQQKGYKLLFAVVWN